MLDFNAEVGRHVWEPMEGFGIAKEDVWEMDQGVIIAGITSNGTDRFFFFPLDGLDSVFETESRWIYANLGLNEGNFAEAWPWTRTYEDINTLIEKYCTEYYVVHTKHGHIIETGDSNGE